MPAKYWLRPARPVVQIGTLLVNLSVANGAQRRIENVSGPHPTNAYSTKQERKESDVLANNQL
jgi:hypothetical protein